ncbi:unnamed protein product [Brassica napus]|uniref:(rape) hypothetical protein n=1 Tax=Brassica napus TaxID=3708 RepID=A0A817AYG1_BRANA|nr:unnamed protein product [Brassica napus]
MMWKARSWFIKEYNNRLFNWLVALSLVMVVVGRDAYGFSVRTCQNLPGHPALDDDGSNALRRLLTAYARHNPSVGYCQVACVTAPWFLSIFINMLPWESVLRVWDVLLFEGNRVMLFRTALALMEFYGPTLITTKDAGDAITLLQSMTGSTFERSQLVFTACMGYQDYALNKDNACSLLHLGLCVAFAYSFAYHRGWNAHLRSLGLNRGLFLQFTKFGAKYEVIQSSGTEGPVLQTSGKSPLELRHGHAETDATTPDGDSGASTRGRATRYHIPARMKEKLRDGLTRVRSRGFRYSRCRRESFDGSRGDHDARCLLDLLISLLVEGSQCYFTWSCIPFALESLRTGLTSFIPQHLIRSLETPIIKQGVRELRKLVSDKKDQEAAMIQVLMGIEQEHKVTEDARRAAEQDAAAQRHAAQEKYEEAVAGLVEMEERAVMAESMLEATFQYHKAQPW